MSTQRWIFVGLGCAALGFAVFGVMVAQVTSVERAAYTTAAARIDSVRASFADPRPVVHTDAEGRIAIDAPPRDPVGSIRTLHVLAYRVDDEGLIRIDIPVWFLRLKDPAIRFVLDDTGIDLKELGLSIGDLRRRGPRIIVDERQENGDLVLLWTEG